MPIGREKPGTGRERPVSPLMLSTSMPLYLKIPNRPKFKTREDPSAAFACQRPAYFSQISP